MTLPDGTTYTWPHFTIWILGTLFTAILGYLFGRMNTSYKEKLAVKIDNARRYDVLISRWNKFLVSLRHNRQGYLSGVQQSNPLYEELMCINNYFRDNKLYFSKEMIRINNYLLTHSRLTVFNGGDRYHTEENYDKLVRNALYWCETMTKLSGFECDLDGLVYGNALTNLFSEMTGNSEYERLKVEVDTQLKLIRPQQF